MGLQGQLTGTLDVSGIKGTFTADLGGVLDALDAVGLPLDPSAAGGVISVAGSLDLSNLNLTAEGLTTAVRSVAGQLPVAGDVLGAITAILDLAERFAAADIETAMTGLVDRLGNELDNLDGGAFGAFTRVAAALKGSPEIDLLKGVYDIFVTAGGAPPLGQIKLPEILPAVAVAIRTLGALMSLETRLAEVERVTETMLRRLDIAAFQAREAALRARLDALPAMVAATDVADTAAVEATARAIADLQLEIQDYLSDVTDGLGFGDAALAYLNFPSLPADIAALAGAVRAEDLSIVERAIADLAGKLGPFLTIDLGAAPRFTLDSLIGLVEGQAATLAQRIRDLDLSFIIGPLEAALAEVTKVPGDVAAKIEDVKLAVRSALQQVSDAVRALPLDTAMSAIRSGADAVDAALGAIAGELESIEDAVNSAVGALQPVLDQVEAAVDTFTGEVEAAFGEAADTVDGLNLDQVASQLADGINSFAATVAKADLAPYFSTASDAIGTAAAVVEKVPFSLLPDSMEEDVVALARPIKQTDLDGFRHEILSVLQIGEDGTFTLRPELEASVAEIQAKMDGLLDAVREHDPEHLAAELQPVLDDAATRINEVSLQVDLAPVRDALNQAKAAVAGFDPAAALQPADAAFDEVLAAVDRFSPEALLAGVDSRIDEIREKIAAAIRLREWRSRLDEVQAQLLSLVALLDLTSLDGDIRSALAGLRARIESSDGLRALDGFGALIGAALAGSGLRASPDAFSAVADWLWGAPAHAHLESHAAAANNAVASVAASVASLDPQALAARLTPGLSRLDAAITAKADGPGKVRLEAAVDIADPVASLVLVGAARGRIQARLAAATTAAGQVRDLSFTDADAAAGRLRGAFAPFAVVPNLLNAIAGIAGIPEAAGRGLSGILLAVLDSAPPERLAAMLTPVYLAVRGRLEELMATVLDPVRHGIDDLIAAIDAVDLGDLSTALVEIHGEVRGEIAAFKPGVLLAGPLAEFAAIKASFAGFDPFAAVDAALAAVRASVARVVAKLDLETILASPQAIFDEIIGALERLDVGTLLEPIFDQLDAIAGQVESGLENTVGAFKRLQDALPDHIGSTSLTVSASASVN